MSAVAEAALEELCNRVGGGKRHFEQILQHLRETDCRTAGDLERQLGLVLMQDAEAGNCEDDFLPPCGPITYPHPIAYPPLHPLMPSERQLGLVLMEDAEAGNCEDDFLPPCGPIAYPHPIAYPPFHPVMPAERQLGLVLMEDAEAGNCEDDFPCPGCEDDFDLPSLCSHMEEEHPELLEEEVDCPVCGRLVRKDVVGHMLSEHVQFSRDRSRRRSGRASSLVESLSLLSNAARKGGSGLMVARGTGAASHRKHADESFLPALADSLIAEEAAKARGGDSQPAATLNPSVGANWTAEEKQEHHEQAVLRAQFVQGLVISTLLKDS